MSSQQDTTESSTPTQPLLCKMGCGFFVSNEVAFEFAGNIYRIDWIGL